MSSLKKQLTNFLKLCKFDVIKNPLFVTLGALSLVLSYFKVLNLPFDIAFVAILLGGIPIMFRAFEAVFVYKKITVNILIATAIIAAIIIDETFAAGEVAFIMMCGEILEEMTVKKANSKLRNLLELSPTKATLLKDGQWVEVVASDIKKGDVILVKTGQAIPADGIIKKGQSSIDQAIMTGESMPAEKGEGDEVLAGCLNLSTPIEILVQSDSEDSTLNRMIEIVAAAKENRAKIERITDKVASFLVPCAILLSVIMFIITGQVIRAVTVLVVFCPCSLVLATPTAIVAALGNASLKGVIIKTGDALERLATINAVCFDKTGTITNGKITVTDFFAYDLSEADAKALMYSLECFSEHPYGAAITRAFKQDAGLPVCGVEVIVGGGIKGEINNQSVIIGNERLITQNGIEISDRQRIVLDSLYSGAKTPVIAAKDGAVFAVTALSDTIKDDAKKAIDKIKKQGISSIYMLTGDNNKTASAIAQQSDISEFYSDLLPEDKSRHILDIKESGAKVAMVGDGINDAAVIASSDIGMAFATSGADLAAQSADIVILGTSMSKVPYIIDLSRSTLRKIKFNITLSMAINVLAITCTFLGLLNPVSGAIVHNAGSVLVVLNSITLLYKKG